MPEYKELVEINAKWVTDFLKEVGHDSELFLSFLDKNNHTKINNMVSSHIRRKIEEKYFSKERGALKLTAREKEILLMMATGKNNKEIGSNLFISNNTVRNHINSIYKKLDVSNRVEATLYLLNAI